MISNFYQPVTYLCLSLIVVGLCLFSACTPSATSGPANTAGAGHAGQALPKMKFHRPKDVAQAVLRVRELYDAIVAKGDLPASIQYEVVEVRHGGPSGHSHYHLAGDTLADDGDGHVTTGTQTHTITVDPITEFSDITRWLPSVAADGEMGEEEWNQVNEASVKFTQQLISVLRGNRTVEAQRKTFQENSAAIEGLVKQLETLPSIKQSK